jgi:very-short-patch-repair endonuclease
VLWKQIRGGQLGWQFRRQHPVGSFVVDFCCCEARLVVEIDGDVHAMPGAVVHDQQRTDYLQSCGHTVQRFTNREVLDSTPAVPEQISRSLKRSDPP